MSQPDQPDQPTATAEDTQPRAREVPKPDKAPVTDPEAPYGWIKDPTAPGGVRPKKRPGKQSTKGEAPPPSRPSAQARQRSAPAGSSKPKDYTGALNEAAEGIWLILAGIPTPDKPTKVIGLDLQSMSIRAKAQAAVLKNNAGQVVMSINLMAQHSRPVQRAVEKYTADTGPAWVLPAMMALVPFAVQSAMVWRVPVQGDLVAMAQQTDNEFTELVKSMTVPPPLHDIENWDSVEAEGSANGEHPASV